MVSDDTYSQEMEEKYRNLVEKWRHNEQMYTKVSNSFKFEFLPRLANEREELKNKIDEFRDEQNSVTKDAGQISQVTTVITNYTKNDGKS